MSKAENFTVRMGENLKERMRAHPEINWSHVIREHVRSMLDDIELMDELAAESQLTEADVDELAAMINEAAADRAREDRERYDPAPGTLHADSDEETPNPRDIEDIDAV